MSDDAGGARRGAAPPADGSGGRIWARPPGPDEYHDHYAGYVDLVPEGDVLRILQEGVATTRALLDPLSASAETGRYAPDKWSVRQVVGHLTDSERLFAFRAVHMARGDPADLPSMDQEIWARGSNAHARPLSGLLDELQAVRGASLHLFRGLPPEALDRRGVASGMEFTVRSFAWITAGHEIHHRRILEERYLPAIRDGEGGA